MDVTSFDKACRQAADAGKAGQTVPALRTYARAISGLMRDFRNRKRDANDSAIEL